MVLYQEDPPSYDDSQQQEQPCYDEKEWLKEVEQMIKFIEEKNPDLKNNIRQLYNEHVFGPEITGGCDNLECGKIFNRLLGSLLELLVFLKPHLTHL